MSLQNKLSRFKKHITVEKQRTANETKDEGYNKSEKVADRIAIPFQEQWRAFNTEVHQFEDEYCLIRTLKYPISHQHGAINFSELKTVVKEWNETSWEHPLSSKGQVPSQLLFFDTETTGLGGGVGNTIFLLGVAKVVDDEIVLKQYFLPQPGNEVALYHHFLTDVNEMKNLVTYNGKAFDWPQVKTRHTLVRDRVPNLPAFGHYDLLHASRRIWKKKLESVRLANVEESILGVKREEDTPGYLAPILYFEYIKENDPEIVQGIFKHNELDVLSLILLYIHLSKIILRADSINMQQIELFEIGRWFEALQLYEQASHCYQKLVNQQGTYVNQAKIQFAGIYKRLKKYDEATSLWIDSVSQGNIVHSSILTELAKAYEHHYKDFEKALYYANLAHKTFKENSQLASLDKDENELYIHRIDRLRNKIAK